MTPQDYLFLYIKSDFINYRNLVRTSVGLTPHIQNMPEIFIKQEKIIKHIKYTIDTYCRPNYNVNYIKYIALKDIYRFCFTDQELTNMSKQHFIVNITPSDFSFEVVIIK